MQDAEVQVALHQSTSFHPAAIAWRSSGSGCVTSSAALTEQFLNVTAKGGISLTNNNNVFQSLTLTNTTSGNITVNAFAGLPLIVTSLSESGGGQTFLTSANGIQLNGTVSAGAGLTATVTAVNGTFSTNASGVVSASGPIAITADNMSFDAASTTTATGANVTLTPETVSTVITLNGADASGVLGLTSAELGTISANNIIIGSTSQTGNINDGTGAFNLPTNVVLITQGNVDLSGLTITSAAGAKLTVDHTGTFSLGTATLSGGLFESGISGSGAGGDVTLSGTVTIGAASVTFNSNVVVFRFGDADHQHHRDQLHLPGH